MVLVPSDIPARTTLRWLCACSSDPATCTHTRCTQAPGRRPSTWPHGVAPGPVQSSVSAYEVAPPPSQVAPGSTSWPSTCSVTVASLLRLSATTAIVDGPGQEPLSAPTAARASASRTIAGSQRRGSIASQHTGDPGRSESPTPAGPRRRHCIRDPGRKVTGGRVTRSCRAMSGTGATANWIDWGRWMRGLGEQVLRARDLLGLSQDQLARIAGVSQGAVSRLEHGRGLATPLLVVSKIAAAL